MKSGLILAKRRKRNGSDTLVICCFAKDKGKKTVMCVVDPLEDREVSLGEMNIEGEGGWYSGLKIFAKDDHLIDNTTGKEEGGAS